MILKQRKEPYRVMVRTGKVISVEDQERFNSSSEFRRFIQSKIFSLGTGLEVKPFFLRSFFRQPDKVEPVASPIPSALITKEIAALPADCLIAQRGEYDILVVEAKDIPNTLKEIGRLREVTFARWMKAPEKRLTWMNTTCTTDN